MPNLNAMNDFMKNSGKDLFNEEDPSMPPKKKPMGGGMPPPDAPMGDAAPEIEDEFKGLFGKEGADYEPPNQEPGHESNETAIQEALEVALGKEVPPEQMTQIMSILNGPSAGPAPTGGNLPVGVSNLKKLGGSKPPMTPPPESPL
jgi:hypothetical protein